MAPTKEENHKGNYRFVRRDGELLRGEEAEEESANVFAEEVMKEIKEKQREKDRLLRLRHPAYNKETSHVSQDVDRVLTRRDTRHSTKEDHGEERKTSKKRNASAHAVRKRLLSAKKRGASTEVDDQVKAYATGLNVAALTADADTASWTSSPQATAAATVLTAQASGGTVEVDVQVKADVKGVEVVAGNVDVRAVDERVFVGAEAVVTGADVKVGNASVAAVKVEKRAGVTVEAKVFELKALNVDAAGVREEEDVGVYVGAKAVEVSALNARVSGVENKVDARAGVELGLLKVGGLNQESDTKNHGPMLDLTLVDLRVPGKGGGGATTVRAGGGAGSSSNSGTDKRSSTDRTRNKGAKSKSIEGLTRGTGDTPTLRNTEASTVTGNRLAHRRDVQTNDITVLQAGVVTNHDDLSLYELDQRQKPFQLPSITHNNTPTQSTKRSKSRYGGDRLKEKSNREADAKDSGRENQRWPDGPDERTTKAQTARKGRRTPASSQPSGKQDTERADWAQHVAREPQSTTSRGQLSSRHTRLNKRRTPVGPAPGNDERKNISKSAAKGRHGNPDNSTARSKLPPLDLSFNDRVLNKVARQADRDATPTSQPFRPRSRRSSSSKFQMLDKEALRDRLLRKYAPSQSTSGSDKTGARTTTREKETETEETVVVKKKPTGLNKNIHGFDTLGMETSKGVKRLGRNIHGFGS
ncbi:Hypp1581 [Branchiostoma lanceolatum]|uniref:Hypp1581 protein n=1 Tax=Branchiostoma lanceolatum TaxID=7740 RepID=A0A8J9ZJ37_BRALA|nr:Hypp1581 [Branchiostoma lanceolatum]